LNFEHRELSLEGSRTTLCTRVVELVVMVASPHLSYMFFLFICFHQVMLAGHALGQAVDVEEGVSVLRPSQGPPSSSGRVKLF
jgi:hypothetical protein